MMKIFAAFLIKDTFSFETNLFSGKWKFFIKIVAIFM